jgi:RNA polymerase sigma-70 factor (ECF subfamily)
MEDELIALLPRLRKFARALCRDDDEADDLLQGACERALSRPGSFTPGTRLDSWMYRIVQNLWIDRCRSRSGRGVAVPVEDVVDLVGSDGRNVTEARLTLAGVRTRIRGMPEEQRLVLALVAVEGLTYREAAEQLGVPLGTVMSRLARARRKLFDFVAPPSDETMAAVGERA